MRKIAFALPAFFLLAALAAGADDTPKPLSIAVEPLGDNDSGVVTRVSFRFSNPPQVPPGTVIYLQGSFISSGEVIRNFRYPVQKDESGAMSAIQVFPPGEASVEVRLVMPVDDGAPSILAKTFETFTVERTNRAYVANVDDGAEGVVAEGAVAESFGAVKIRPPRRDVAPNLFIVDVDVLAPVKRVEFWVEGRKIMARNAPPYSAELDLGKLPKRVEVRAVGFDSRGRYVDADAFVVNERQTPLEVRITRTATPDGLSHFKLSVQNPKGTILRTVELYAGDTRLHTWSRPPYSLALPASVLAAHEFVRASVVDETGYEASDLLFLSGDRYVEEIDVNVIELPISVTDTSGAPIADLGSSNFTVLENGARQQIASFNFAANLPFSVGVLIDHSGSMEKRIDDARAAALAFLENVVRKDDRAFIAGFAADPARNAPFVSELATLQAQVAALPEARGSTSLYDAIVTGLYRFRDVEGRKALIIISDGDDTASRLSYDDMLTYVRASRVPLYFIGIGFGLGELGGPGKMRALAAETGGVAYFIRGTDRLRETYEALERDLRSQYLVTYQTEAAKNDQAYRKVDVKVDRPDARVRTIRGYIP